MEQKSKKKNKKLNVIVNPDHPRRIALLKDEQTQEMIDDIADDIAESIDFKKALKKLEERIDRIVAAHDKCKSLKGL